MPCCVTGRSATCERSVTKGEGGGQSVSRPAVTRRGSQGLELPHGLEEWENAGVRGVSPPPPHLHVGGHSADSAAGGARPHRPAHARGRAAHHPGGHGAGKKCVDPPTSTGVFIVLFFYEELQFHSIARVMVPTVQGGRRAGHTLLGSQVHRSEFIACREHTPNLEVAAASRP